MINQSNEADKVTERYARRNANSYKDMYSILNTSVWQTLQEKQRALIQLLRDHADRRLDEMSVLEIGCGSGNNLLELLRMGFSPDKLAGNELLPERFSVARRNLPSALALHEGDATKLAFPNGSFDVVYQSTVFSSLMDDEFQAKLAYRVWDWVRPGGGVLWYDFTYDNPSNPDVKGVSLARIRQLFPEGVVHSRRVTLAPPISRRVCKLHPALYTLLNTLPLLRTHVLCWIEKK